MLIECISVCPAYLTTSELNNKQHVRIEHLPSSESTWLGLACSLAWMKKLLVAEEGGRRLAQNEAVYLRAKFSTDSSVYFQSCHFFTKQRKLHRVEARVRNLSPWWTTHMITTIMMGIFLSTGEERRPGARTSERS